MLADWRRRSAIRGAVLGFAFVLCGCSLVIDSSDYVGPGTDAGGRDGGLDAGPGDAGDRCAEVLCVGTQACHPATGTCMDPVCLEVDDPTVCVDPSCCDCDGDGFVRDNGACGDGEFPDCDDLNARRFPTAPPVCDTPGPDNCGVEIIPGFSDWLSTFGFVEAGPMFPTPVQDDSGNPLLVGRTPQLSVARFTSDSEDDIDGAFVFINDEGVDESRVLVAPYSVTSGMFGAVDLVGTVGDGDLPFTYGSAQSVSAFPDGSAMSLLVDGDRVVLIGATPMGYQVAHDFPMDSPIASPFWPVGVVETGEGQRSAVWRQGRQLRAMDGAGRVTGTPGSAVSAVAGAPLRVGQDLVVARRGLFGEDELVLWDLDTVHPVGGLPELLGPHDVTDVTPTGGAERVYTIAMPTRESGAPWVRFIRVQCGPGDTLAECDMKTRRELPATAQSLVALGSIMVRRDGPDPEPVVVAAVSTSSGSVGGAAEVWIHFVDSEGKALPALGQGVLPEGDFSFPLLVPESSDVTVRGLDMVALGNDRGYDVVLGAALGTGVGTPSTIWMTGFRVCLPR